MNQTEDWRPKNLTPSPNPAAEDTSSPDDPRVVLALQEYQAFLNAGQKLDREEFLARYPEIAERLAECLEGLDLIQAAALHCQAPAGDQPIASPAFRGFSPDTTLGDYCILQEIGRGGMGVVYKARQVSLNRIVALKMILAGQLAASGDVQRFRAEAEAAANLDHPNIVPILEVGEEQGQHYFSMKLIEGNNLAQWIADCRLQIADFQKQTQAAIARLLTIVARAVHYAHQHGILHRDLKPANILLQPGGDSSQSAISNLQSAIPMVTDFGLAKRIATGEKPAPSEGGGIVGTPTYMAPEQAAGKKGLSTAADVYSLGAILYELLTRQPPFRGETSLGILRQVQELDPPRPRTLNPLLNRDLETICLTCLEKEPERRYGSAEALAEDLERWLAGEPIRARPSRFWERGVKWAKRRPAVAALVAVSSLASVLLLTALVVSNWIVSQALDDRTKALARELQTGYCQNIALADRETLVANPQSERVHQLLDACPVELRHWEWHYLRRLWHAELAALAAPAEPACVLFNPDGKRLASAGGVLGKPGEVKIWDLATGQVILKFQGHRDAITGLAFSTDGEQLASASADQTIKVCEARSGKKIITLRGHQGSVSSVAFSSDGQRLASGSADQTIKIWDWKKAREIQTLRGHTDSVWSVDFSPDGLRLASASSDRTVKVWNTSMGEEIFTLRGHRGIVRSVVFSRDGRYLASAGYDNTVKIWDALSGQEVLTCQGHSKFVTSLAFSPDSRRLASASVDRTVKIWDAATGAELETLRGHDDSIWSVNYSPDGGRLATVSSDGTVKLWKGINKLVEPAHYGISELDPKVVVSSSDERFAFVKGGTVIEVWNAESGLKACTITGLALPLDQLAISPNGQRIAAKKDFQTIGIWNADEGNFIQSLIGVTDGITGLTFSDDSKQLAVASRGQEVRIWEIETGRVLIALEQSQSVSSLLFAPDAKTIAGIVSDRQAPGNQQDSGVCEVKVWDVNSARLIFRLPQAGGPVAFGLDGILVSAAGGGSSASEAKVWDIVSGQGKGTLRGHIDQITALAFSPDGLRIASASRDRTIKIWDAQTGREILTLAGPPSPVTNLRFSGDGYRLLATCSDGSVRVWDATPL